MSTKEKHLNHSFYKEVNKYREEVRIGQIIKGSEKYPEPFTTSSWSNDEIIEHAMQGNVDQAHYIYAAKERMKELEKSLSEMKKLHFSLNKDIDKALRDVGLERLSQNEKWGLQRHEYGTWLQILIEEVGEVAQAMQKGKDWGKSSDADDLYSELIQVAAVAVAIAEQVREENGG